MRRMLFVALFATLGACGGGDDGGIDQGPTATEGTANPTALTSAALQADGLRAALASGNGEQMASASVVLSMSAMSAVEPRSTTQGLTVVEQMLTATGDETYTGTRECDASGCRFDGFGNGQFSLSGSVTASDMEDGAKRFTWALSGTGQDFGGEQAGFDDFDFSYTWRGDLVVSSTEVSGMAGASWQGSGSANGQSFSFNYGSFTNFMEVMVKNNCPTSGSIFAKWWISAHANGRSQTEAYQAKHTFDGCAR